MPAREQQAIGGEGAAGLPVQVSEHYRAYLAAAQHAAHDDAGMHLEPERARAIGGVRGGAHINDRAAHSSRVEREGGLIRFV